MKDEIWKDIEEYEGLYQVSNMGRVMSLDHVADRGWHKDVSIQGKVLHPSGTPYLGVMLSKNGKAHPKRVHRLVAIAFVPNPENLPVVDHIDGNKKNNAASNLRWCTHKQNTSYAIDSGLITFERCGFHSWPEESQKNYRKTRKKPIVRSDGRRYECTAEAARDLGVTYSAVSHVLRGLSQTCKGYSFSYV